MYSVVSLCSSAIRERDCPSAFLPPGSSRAASMTVEQHRCEHCCPAMHPVALRNDVALHTPTASPRPTASAVNLAHNQGWYLVRKTVSGNFPDSGRPFPDIWCSDIREYPPRRRTSYLIDGCHVRGPRSTSRSCGARHLLGTHTRVPPYALAAHLATPWLLHDSEPRETAE